MVTHMSRLFKEAISTSLSRTHSFAVLSGLVLCLLSHAPTLMVATRPLDVVIADNTSRKLKMLQGFDDAELYRRGIYELGKKKVDAFAADEASRKHEETEDPIVIYGCPSLALTAANKFLQLGVHSASLLLVMPSSRGIDQLEDLDNQMV